MDSKHSAVAAAAVHCSHSTHFEEVEAAHRSTRAEAEEGSCDVGLEVAHLVQKHLAGVQSQDSNAGRMG